MLVVERAQPAIHFLSKNPRPLTAPEPAGKAPQRKNKCPIFIAGGDNQEMPDVDDMTLVREYADRNSESAFAELVHRHVNLVYSVALRLTANCEDAQDVTQAVFIILAQKAAALRPGTILTGWLYGTTRFTAMNHSRAKARQQAREREAYMQSTLDDSNPDRAWKQLAPLLEEAMTRLGEKERTLLALRFFENKSVAETAAIFGIQEWAARKRVERAVEKLRRFFAQRGVVLPSAVLTGAISANSVQAAPEALAKSVISVAAAKGAAASSSTITLAKGALKLMAWTKAKTAVIAGVAVLLATGTTTLTVKELRQLGAYSWQVPKADFRELYNAPPQVRIVPTRFSQDGGHVTNSGTGTLGIGQPLKEILQAAYQKSSSRTVMAAAMPPGKYDFLAKLPDGRSADTNWTIALQNEIARKFGIIGRLEMRETDVMLLTPGNTGTQNVKESHKMPQGTALAPGVRGFSFHAQPISILARALEDLLRIPIVDQSGLTNSYDFTIPLELGWQTNQEGLKMAFREQLGLELVPAKMPIEMLVVEKAK
jgi:uncharacterized protein (TIGR03435 family)